MFNHGNDREHDYSKCFHYQMGVVGEWNPVDRDGAQKSSGPSTG